MARPKKVGLDYFPVDVDFDDKIQALELIHGNDGLAWLLRFWQTAYKTEDGIVDLSELFGELMANKCRITTEKQNSIIELLRKVGHLQHCGDGKYTSHGIQKRISAISSERRAAIERKNQRESQKTKKKEIKEKRKESKTPPQCSLNNENSSANNEIDPPIKNENTIPPQIEWLLSYKKERNSVVDANKFFDFYSSKGWMVGKNRMKDWKAAFRRWENDDSGIKKPSPEFSANACRRGENGKLVPVV